MMGRLYAPKAAWLEALPDLHRRLQTNPPARIADIGCAAGWSSIGVAQSYPNVHIDGFDIDSSADFSS